MKIKNLHFIPFCLMLSYLGAAAPNWATEPKTATPSSPCQKILTDAQNQIFQPVLALSLMRCFAENEVSTKAQIFAWETLNSTFWAPEILALKEAQKNIKNKEKETAALLVKAPIELLSRTAHVSDRKRREALAELLIHVMDHGKTQNQQLAHKKLYVELGDTDAAKARLKQKPFVATPEEKAHRIENLSLRHENKIILKEGPKALSAQPLNEHTCLIAYQIGKSGRKKRHYKTAHRYLDRVLKECKGDPVRKALYMKAKVASFQNLAPALPVYNRFLAEHAQDSLADDVMMMKALHLENSKKTAEAIESYQNLLAQYEKGDQWNIAAFRLAFALARSGDTQAAIDQLDALARKDKLDSFTQDRALYWRGRLKIYPKLQKLDVTKSDEQKAMGRQELLVLSQNRSASYYGHLALRLLHHGFEKGHFGEKASVPPAFTPAPKNIPSVAQELDNQTEELHLVQKLLDSGYKAEAIWILDRLGVDGTISLYQKALGYFLAGAYGKSHRTLRKARLHWPHGKPVAQSMETWLLAFPKAYAAAFQQAAAAHQLPQSMLWGLSREESAFEKDVTSWAGARGLCQLMPATAREEAELAQIALKDLNQLFEPQTNTLLGAQHLRRRLDLLKHPFLAIAAYNAGPGNVHKWRKKLADYEAMDAFVEAIPVDQTRNYVRKVVGSWVTYAFFTGETAETDFSLVLPPK